VEKITLGPARRILLNPVDRECTAYHESGHALLGLLVPGSDPMHRVAIEPRGMALGHLSAPHRRSHQLRRGLSPRAHAGGLVQSPGTTRCCLDT
jgi:ATP-dependent Zn protease